jgi:hypothetical protein
MKTLITIPHLSRTLSLFVLVGALALAPRLQANEDVPNVDEAPSADFEGLFGPTPKDPKGVWQHYQATMDNLIKRAIELDLYGVTAQLPQGVASAKWDYTVLKANRRYDNHRRLGKLLAPLELGGETIDLGMGGEGGGHTFQFSYGIIDSLDWYFELPYMFMDVAFNPNDAAKNFFCTVFPSLGRQIPDMRYKAKWVMGDINTGFSWNIYRNKVLSVALTPRIYLPTGHQPSPNRSLTYAMGPELEMGIGGWAVGFTQGYDVKLFQWSHWVGAVASTEFAFSYALPQTRKYPSNFTQGAQLPGEEGKMFPDLSHLNPENPNYINDRDFTYIPGMGFSWLGQINFSVLNFGFGAAIGLDHSAEAEFGGDTDPAFQMMADALELTGTQTLYAMQLACSVNLLPFYIPAEVAFQWRKAIDGYNAIVFDDYYQIMIKGYFPVLPSLWK